MRNVISLILATSLLLAGLSIVGWQILYGTQIGGMIGWSGATMAILGGLWLWEDIKQR